MYVSKHWSVSEWDCWRRNKNVYAWDDEMGRLCTNDSKTEKIVLIRNMDAALLILFTTRRP